MDKFIPDIRTLESIRDYCHEAGHKDALASLTEYIEEGRPSEDKDAEIALLRHKADQYDSVVRELKVSDNGRYRADTEESILIALRKKDEEIARLRVMVERAVGILEAWPSYGDWEDAIDEAVAILRQPLAPAPSQGQEGEG